MKRRTFFKTGLVVAGITVLSGHTPYGQWVVYRKKHLLIGCHKTGPRTYELAKQVVAVLETHLPAAKARVARAPTTGRLASLIGTDQLGVAILHHTDAVAMLEGSGDFQPYGPVPLRLITPVGDRVMIARNDFPNRHAWLVTNALLLAKLAPELDASLDAIPPWHPGSLARLQGEPEPALIAGQAAD